MPLINCKIELSLSFIKNCVLTTAANTSSATFKITDAKLYVPVVNLSAEYNAKLTKQLNEGFKRQVYWNKYKVIDNKVMLKELKDFLFLLMVIQQVIIKFLSILSKNSFYQE